MKKFPPTIYVTREENDGYLLVNGEMVSDLDASDGDLVATYKLVEVATFRANPRLEKKQRMKETP